ncbi:hypothetical protein KY285_001893 [Solanum tuberosum]|nr:hypothetical protein KY284_002049 [Solanum tuberosum]KAH0766022.1 hypothetical protein KY285_001893 [Solanum tuberosum]
MKYKPFCDAIKDVLRMVDKSDWEWSNLSMPHHTGSKPIREIVYEFGGKDGKQPNMDIIFFETHKNNNKLVKPETNAKYVEIQELVQSNSSLTILR